MWETMSDREREEWVGHINKCILDLKNGEIMLGDLVFYLLNYEFINKWTMSPR